MRQVLVCLLLLAGALGMRAQEDPEYKMEIGGTVPKTFTMKVLEYDVMEYGDEFGVNHKFDRVEELRLIQ